MYAQEHIKNKAQDYILQSTEHVKLHKTLEGHSHTCKTLIQAHYFKIKLIDHSHLKDIHFLDNIFGFNPKLKFFKFIHSLNTKYHSLSI